MLAVTISAFLSLFAVADVQSTLPPKPVVAQLVRDAAEAGRARVEVTLQRSDIVNVVVEALDEHGETLATHTLVPRDKDLFRARMSVRFALDVDAQIHSVKVSAFTVKSTAAKSPVFNTVLSDAIRVNGCTGLCNPTRYECNQICWLMSCASATYSCTEASGCEAVCTCLDCPP